jgi:hypothetical protein
MWRYFKHALLFRVPTRLLGDVPLNAVGIACFGMLGIANPGFWFLGAGLEAGYLAAMLSSRRFRKWVQAREHAATVHDAQMEIGERVRRLGDARRKRHAELERKCARVGQLYREREVEEFLVEGNLAALEKLRDLYVQLLAVEQDIDSADRREAEMLLRRQAADLEKELAGARLGGPVRDSKTATLTLLQKRIATLERRQETLEEISSDLQRIEAQVDLALENALIEGKPQVISMSIDLASHLLDLPSIEPVRGEAGSSLAPSAPSPQRRLESE